MTPISRQHWKNLYAQLHDAYVDCLKHHNGTYEVKLGMLLDDMIEDKNRLKYYD